MKILIHGLNFYPELVGIGKYTGDLALWLAGRGHQVSVITTPPYYPAWQVKPPYSAKRWQEETWQGIEIVRCPLWLPKQASGLKRILHLSSFALSSCLPARRLAKTKPDVIFSVAPALLAAPAALAAGRAAAAPTWLHIQDFEVDAALELGLVSRNNFIRRSALKFERRMLGKFDLVSTISEKMIERLSQKGVPSERQVYFPNWVDTQEIFPMQTPNPLRQELGLQESDFVVLYAGSMGVKQGLEVLIEAAGRLQKQTKIRFVICGDGPAKASLQQLAAGLSNVHFLPLQPTAQLNQLLNLADLHVLPQKRGASDLVMPSKLLGMLASGKPVLAGCVTESALGRVVENVGIRIEPEDAEVLANQILRLANDINLCQDLGEKGRAYAEQNFSRETVLMNFEERLSALCEHAKKKS